MTLEWLLTTRAKVSRIGGKASNLAVLAQHRVPVPAAFVVPADIMSAEFERKTDSAMALSSDVTKEILAGYAQLATQSVAVRSSAVNEDSEQASFAGQFRTFLSVNGEQELTQSVIDCWLSLNGAAVNYARLKDLPRPTAMAVIVQEMVEPDYAGVVFTRNPVTGSNAFEIEFVQGSAAELVAGSVIPFRLTVDRRPGKVDRMQGQPFPEQDSLENLLDWATRCEEIFGVPQDIEWARSRGQLFILQSRPITSLLGL